MDTYEGQIDNPLSLNLYTCVEKNSLIHVGPSGHIPTQLEAAMMANKVYSAEKEKKMLFQVGVILSI
ncbi:hypothetical protein ACE6ED_24750 [Paenibacillus sp. CN-4]|uniref:hypothetical protein n=1 Tax=Paenibacillus nanchangensis TaxID=3348343 RepID=UPI00397DB884